MADDAFQELQRDRVSVMLTRNETLPKSLMGLFRQVLRQCDKYGWDPRSMSVRTPHLDSRGFLEVKYTPRRWGRSGYQSAFSAPDIPTMLMQKNAVIVALLRYCRSWRQALDQIYYQADSYAFDKGVRFRSLEFGAFHIETARRRAWCWIARDQEQKVEYERAGKG